MSDRYQLFQDSLQKEGLVNTEIYQEVFSILEKNNVSDVFLRSMLRAEVDPKKIFVLLSDVRELVSLGLNPDPIKGMVYLQNNTLVMSWRGMVKAVYSQKAADAIVADAVYSGDDFSVETDGTARKVKHIIHHINDRGDLIGAYAYAIKSAQCHYVSTLNKEELAFIQKRTKSNAWANFPNEMVRKVAIRRLIKSLDFQNIDDRLMGTSLQFEDESIN